ncbi:MAG: phosphotransferase [Clostridia bacterium]|nr:phosphotransferase [Clostridia bacterium]MBR5427073.1 phosphotransferase [Clostridia bacterium]
MFSVSTKSENGILTAALSGRIDSVNAAEAETKINAAVAGCTGAPVLDAAELAYLSSAGLRVILRLKKAYPGLKIVNVSSEVYEIFDMTGFTEMMEISKAYRKVSVEGCEVIGEGANGIVYRIDEDTIVKVYKNHDALAEIHNERELARKAFVMGVPTAIPYDVVQVGELYGSVFELLNAKSFAKLMIAEPEKTDEYAKQSAEILKTIHSTVLKPGELPDKKAEAVIWAEFCTEYLPADVGEKLLRMMREIPDTQNMIHGDYHIKNIMRQNGENLLIDMDTLAMGHPVFEFAAIYLAYVGFSCIDHNNVKDFLGISYEQARAFWNATLRSYFDTGDEAFLRSIENMSAVIGYARLLRRTVRKSRDSEEYKTKMIDYCKNTLCELVPQTDKLYF